MSPLRAAIAAWEAADAACTTGFAQALVDMQKELADGPATTSAKNGYCHTYEWGEGSWIEGAAWADSVVRTEAGNRCHAIAKAYRKRAYDLNDAIEKVESLIMAKIDGTRLNLDKTHLAHAARALVRSDIL